LDSTKTEAVIFGTSQRLSQGNYYHKVSVLPERTCSLLTTSNCLEWRSTQHCPSTSTLSMSLAPVVRCVIYNHRCHWMWRSDTQHEDKIYKNKIILSFQQNKRARW